MDLYITKPENIRYQTGFIGSFGITLILNKNKYLITDGRYKEQAKKLCNKDVNVIILEESLAEEIEKLFKKHKIKEIGFEANHLSYYQALQLRKTFKTTKFTPLDKQIDQMRIIKSNQEIKLIQKSQQINEHVLKEIITKQLKTGVTETEIAWQIYKIGRNLGAEGTSFDPIVAFGTNSASPHYSPSKNRKLKKGDVVLIDMGMIYEGYCSDMTRTFFTKSPSNLETEVYNTVLEAQENAIKNIKAGQLGSAGDKFSRETITNAGYGEFFTHANGHGVGLEIHEAPSLSSKTKHKDRRIKFQENMVVTIEPGIYIPNKFGVRIEDMIVIQSKKNKNLTKFPKNLAEIIIST